MTLAQQANRLPVNAGRLPCCGCCRPVRRAGGLRHSPAPSSESSPSAIEVPQPDLHNLENAAALVALALRISTPRPPSDADVAPVLATIRSRVGRCSPGAGSSAPTTRRRPTCS
jgi:hypothetical protein